MSILSLFHIKLNERQNIALYLEMLYRLRNRTRSQYGGTRLGRI